MSTLIQKKAVIIGGSSGIGLEIGHLFVKEGVEVIIVGRNSAKLEKSVDFLGKQATSIQADISNEVEVCRIFSLIEALDFLVITASVPASGKILEMSTEFVDKVFRTKFYGAFWSAKYGVPKINRGGSIITISGIWGHIPPSGFVVGAAANGAIEGLTRALAVELAEREIRVNCVSPGITKTNSYIDENNISYRDYLDKIPLKRFGLPEEIARAALFLATNTCLTGIVLNVDGGALTSEI